MTRSRIAGRAAGWCLLAAAGAAAPARGQDPAPPVLETVKDPKGLVSIGVPKGAEVAVVAEDPFLLAAWKADLDPGKPEPELFVYVFQRPQFARAELAGSMGRGCRWGAREDDSIVAKGGEWRDVRVNSTKDALWCQRIVAAKGQVWFAVTQTRKLDHDLYKSVGEAVLASFQVLEAPKPSPLPAGFKSSTAGGREVWTDGKKSDVERIVREWGNGVALWPKLLAEKPVYPHPPRLIVCAKDEDYEALWGDAGDEAAPRYAYYSVSRRAVVARGTLRQEDQLYAAVNRACGEQMSEYQFGGRCPLWLHQGLRVVLNEGVLSNGHFDQPRAETIEKAMTSATTRNVPFADVLAMTDIPRVGRDGIDRELYAWHFFFRWGPGAKTEGARYQKYLKTLRETGDVRAADAVWVGMDHRKLDTDFMAWIRRWREGRND